MSNSELDSLSFDELYQRYDTSTDEGEKLQIKKAVESKELIQDPDFEPYPQLNNSNFQEIIFKKKEFNANQLFLDSTGSENPCSGEFSIKPHQIVLKNFMNKESPYKSILVYHGVGVGKTCSGLTIADNFRDMYGRKDRRILILCSKNIQIGWKKTIYTPEKKSNQCTGDSFTNSEASTSRQVNKLIKQYYEIMAYQSFANFVKRKQTEYARSFPEQEKEQRKLEWFNDYFEGRLVIIDEAHNIRDDQGKEMRDAVKTIESVIKYSKDIRLVLLTATPMYNRASEIIWMLNMMLLNDNRELIDTKSIFNKQGELTETGKQIIEEKSRGYVSYLRGENPITFPLRLMPSILIDNNNDPMYPKYSKQHAKSIVCKSNSPSINLVGGDIKARDKFKFLELFGSKMKGAQELVYKQAIQTIVASNPELNLDDRGEKNNILDNILLTQLTNFVFPVPSKNLKKDLLDGTIKVEDCYGINGIKNTLGRKGKTYTYKDPSYPFFDKGLIGNHSSKMKSILDEVDNTDGIVFIYTNYVEAGITPLQLMLEHNGYKRFDKRKVLSFPDYKPSLPKHKCKREPMSYNGMRKSQVTEDFKQASFIVIDGSSNKKELSEQLNIISSNRNKQGERIKIILGTVVASEGLDFKRIRSVHILDPWLHLNRIEQTVGRGIRFCSHSDLDVINRNVLIYLHATTLQDDRETVDTSIYRYAEKKSIQIGKVETILKKNAIDRYLYENVNIIAKRSLNVVSVKPPIYQSQKISVDPTDKSYSKVCSYMEECDYNKNDRQYDRNITEQDFTLNKDTYFEKYSRNAIQNIKKKIALLFTEFYVFKIDSILGLMNEYGFTYDDMVYQALSEMIEEKYIIHGNNKHTGYIINRAKYYIFQPFLYEDRFLPLQYRAKLLEIPNKVIKLDKLNIVKDKPSFSEVYTLTSIKNIYATAFDEYIDSEFIMIIDRIKDVYDEIDIYHPSVVGYLFDRLSFSDKCGLMYGLFISRSLDEGWDSESNYQSPCESILSELIIYKTDRDDYYFGPEVKGKTLKPFGFYVTFQNKPYFYEYIDSRIQECDQVQEINIKKSLTRFKTSVEGKAFKKNSTLWGYTIWRSKKNTDGTYNQQTVLKFVPPGVSDAKYPPGPGNVCIENNLGSSKEKLNDLFTQYIPEVSELTNDELISNKKNLCLLLEIALRFKSEFRFYRMDTMWLKYL